MNVADACFSTVHDYPGGAEALGPRLGKLGTSLSAEVRMVPPGGAFSSDPKRSQAKLGVLDAVRIMQMTGDYRVLYAMAGELGHFPPMPMPNDLDAGMPCMQNMGEVCCAVGVLMEEVARDTADGKVTNPEYAAAVRQAGALVAAVQRLMRQLAAMNAEHRVAEAPGAAS
ncbi:phage regulatory CII family protein [Roseateles sp. P5_E7]